MHCGLRRGKIVTHSLKLFGWGRRHLGIGIPRRCKLPLGFRVALEHQQCVAPPGARDR